MVADRQPEAWVIAYAIYGPLDEADAMFCVRGWEPDAAARTTRLAFEVFAADLPDARTLVPDGYRRHDPSAAERKDNPRLIETWWPNEKEAAP